MTPLRDAPPLPVPPFFFLLHTCKLELQRPPLDHEVPLQWKARCKSEGEREGLRIPDDCGTSEGLDCLPPDFSYLREKEVFYLV